MNDSHHHDPTDSEPPYSTSPMGNRPMGGRLVPGNGGASFKIWAPSARSVSVLSGYKQQASGVWHSTQKHPLFRSEGGVWVGYVEGLVSGDRYMFHIVGPEGGTSGNKRDPYALDLTEDPGWPDCQCLLYDENAFPWHDQDFLAPPFNELSIYQLHVGTWFIPEDSHHGTFLDVMSRIDYLASLGVRAVQLLPIVEFPGFFSLGYNGIDYFSPETNYGIVDDDPRLGAYLKRANTLLSQAQPGAAAYHLSDIQGTANQLRLLIDLCHVHGLSVILDVVYNHAGGDFDPAGIYFLDGQPQGDQNRSLYFTDKGWAGGLVFAYWNDNVRQFLIDNAQFWLKDCHADGLRYDEVSVIRREGGEFGHKLCQDVTDTCHFVKPSAIHIGEHWPPEQEIVNPTAYGGAGFDACLNDGLREAIRGAVSQAAGGSSSHVDMDRLAHELTTPNLNDSWRAVQMCENHDIVKHGEGPRMPSLADGSNSRSWYARSRSRVALGLVATAPGIPHLFMGQEILEDKQWSDDPQSPLGIWWDGLNQDPHMATFLRFSRELMHLRRHLRALTSSGLHVFHTHNENRILAFHRWVPGVGDDVIVVSSFNEQTFWDYQLGLPGGTWLELFNSDAYESQPSHVTTGNGGQIVAEGSPRHTMPSSASLVIPANGLLVFGRAS